MKPTTKKNAKKNCGPAKRRANACSTSAQTTATAAANKDKVRLQVRYTTSSPTTVTVAYGLHGGKARSTSGRQENASPGRASCV